MKFVVLCTLIMGIFSASVLMAHSYLPKDNTLYVSGYAHLDTQWRWDYRKTIDDYIVNTLEDNFALLEKYPDYTFNFTGSSRYQMMKEYYPEKFAKMKKYIDEGRWYVSGSSVDECDVLIPSPESILRQVLYGNQYFRKEFGKESVDFMLPDCFGFPAYLPSLWKHCGLLGFSTQKLSWGSAVGVPFNVGVWDGPDGESIIGALNGTSYGGSLPERQDIDPAWVSRMLGNGEGSGVFVDFRYYGVGDIGGAPREEDVQKAMNALGNDDSILNVKLSATDQLYKDLTEEQIAKLPHYSGELLLTEHSSGASTSKTFMKRMNRKNELLADAAERAAAAANWMGAAEYPEYLLKESWKRVLVSQMHDIMPGTSLQRCYEYSWNDELLAANGFASILTNSVAGVSRGLDTTVKGKALAVYNPLAFEREDVVKASVVFPEGAPEYVRVYNDENKEVPSQVVKVEGNTVEVLFVAELDSVSLSVYDVRPSSKPCKKNTGLKVDGQTLENEYYVVTINDAGDIASVYDKEAEKELLAEPARLEFHRSVPNAWPAWNQDWKDRRLPATGYVDGPAEIKVVENGPARIAIEVKREARNSYFTQRISLSAGTGGKRVEVANDIDWQSKAVLLKAAFPLTVYNQTANYTQGMGIIQNGNNSPIKYEFLSHQWFDLTDNSGEYGVSVLEDCKFGSDKPTDNVVRLSLIYTPGYKRGSYVDQLTQDWGHNSVTYALYGHEKSWQQGRSELQARRLNQPVQAFQVPEHKGELGKSYSIASLNTNKVDIRALKKAEDSDYVIVRLQELLGGSVDGVEVTVGDGIVSGYETNGQEQKIGPATIEDGKLVVDMTRFSMKTFALKLAKPEAKLSAPKSKSLDLPYNAVAFTSDKQGLAGDMGADNMSMPVEEVPAELSADSIKFKLVKDSTVKNAVACEGQKIKLPAGNYNKVYFLASADKDVTSDIKLGKKSLPFSVQAWTGFIAQWDKRIFDREAHEVDYVGLGWVTDIVKGYINRDDVAWYCTHRHDSKNMNESYLFSYMFKYSFDLEGNEKEITLPNDPSIKIYAATVANDENIAMRATQLYDNFDNRKDLVLRDQEMASFESGLEPLAEVKIEKAESYDALTICKPSDSDYGDQNAGNKVEYVWFTDGYAVAPTRGNSDSGLPSLPRINNGEVSQNDDDLERVTHFDSGLGHFIADLKKIVNVSKINTFSWHKGNRAIQKFSVWAAKEALDPFTAAEAGWTFIGTVDTTELGSGGVQVSSVIFPEGSDYRYIMFVTDLFDEGTFFNEIDIEAK